MKAVLILALLLATPVEPHFKRSPRGWIPSCPAGTDLIRHDPKPDCFWGAAPLHRKPTAGDMECVSIKRASKLPMCPVE